MAEQEEKRRFENEYERTRKEALERMKQAEEKKNAEERKRAEELRKQMEELKLREEEVFRTLTKYFYVEMGYCRCAFFKSIFLSQATRLKKEQEALLVKQWELEKIEEERREVEERRKKSEMG